MLRTWCAPPFAGNVMCAPFVPGSGIVPAGGTQLQYSTSPRSPSSWTSRKMSVSSGQLAGNAAVDAAPHQFRRAFTALEPAWKTSTYPGAFSTRDIESTAGSPSPAT
jgi:hypothetical protein